MVRAAYRNLGRLGKRGLRSARRVGKWASAIAGVYGGMRSGRRTRQGFRKKGHASYTKTANKGSASGSDHHSGVARGRRTFVRSVKGLKRNEKVCGSLQYRQTNNSIITAPSGTQQVAEIAFAGTKSQWTTSTGSTYNDIATNSYTAYFDLDPNRKITGSNTLTAGTVPLNGPMFMRTLQFVVDISNFASIGTYVDLYLCMCKQHTDLTPVSAWNRGNLEDSLSQSVWVPPSAAVAPAAGTPGYPGASYPTSKPHDSLVFKKFFKVVDKQSINLSSGSAHTATFNVVASKLTRIEAVNATPAGTVSLANTTYCVMMVVKGEVVRDSASGAPDAVYGKAVIGYVVNTKINLATIESGSGKTRLNRVVSNLPVGALNTELEHIDENDLLADEITLV